MLHFIKSVVALPFGVVANLFNFVYSTRSPTGAPIPQGARKNGQKFKLQYLLGAGLAAVFALVFLLQPTITKVKILAGNTQIIEQAQAVHSETVGVDTKTLIVSSKGEGEAYIMAKSALNQWMQKTGNPWTHHPSYTRYGIASSLKKLDNWLGTGSGAAVQDIPEAIPYDIDTMKTLIVSVNTDLGQGVCLNKQMQKVQCDQIHRDNLKNIANYEQFKTQTDLTAALKQIAEVVEPLPDIPELGLLGMERGKVKPVLNPWDIPPVEDWALMKGQQTDNKTTPQTATGLTPAQAREKLTTAKLYGGGAVLLALFFLFVLKNTESTLIITPIFFAGFFCALAAIGDYGEWQKSPEYLSGADVLAYTAAPEKTAYKFTLTPLKMDAARDLLAFSGTGFLFLGLLGLPVYGLVKKYLGYPFLFVGAGLLGLYWFTYFSAGQQIQVIHAGAFASTALMFSLVFLPAVIFCIWEAVKETHTYREIFIEGKGDANARWAGVATFWKMDITSWFRKSARQGIQKGEYSPLLVGSTMWNYDPALFPRYIGTTTEQHLITIAGTGAGKSRDSIKPAILTYGAGVVGFDTKGDIALDAYKIRSKFAPFYNIDPWNTTKGAIPVVGWNPLNEIDINHPDARDRLDNIAYALVPDEEGNSHGQHFLQTARNLVAGYIAHVMSIYPAKYHHLPAVFNLIIFGEPEGVGGGENSGEGWKAAALEMASNPVCNGLAKEAAIRLDQLVDRELSGMQSTLHRSLSWVKSPLLEKSLTAKKEFSFADCKIKDASVFLSLPEEQINLKGRYLRLFYQMAFDMMNEHRTKQPEGSKRRVLFLFDEFAALGRFKPAEDAVLRIRSSFVKCWFIVQDFSALDIYPNPKKFLAGCDKQIFGTGKDDPETAEDISRILGNFTVKELGREGVQEVSKPIMSPEEVRGVLSMERNTQLFLPLSGFPMRLRKVNYTKVWKELKRG